MSDNSKIASESMKILTEKVLRADLGSRKRKMIHFKSITYASLVWVPCLMYGIYSTLYSQGLLMQVNRQAGEPYNIWKTIFGNNNIPARQLFRPEIYHRDQALKLKYYANITAQEVSKDEKIVFKPYIWS